VETSVLHYSETMPIPVADRTSSLPVSLRYRHLSEVSL